MNFNNTITYIKIFIKQSSKHFFIFLLQLILTLIIAGVMTNGGEIFSKKGDDQLIGYIFVGLFIRIIILQIKEFMSKIISNSNKKDIINYYKKKISNNTKEIINIQKNIELNKEFLNKLKIISLDKKISNNEFNNLFYLIETIYDNKEIIANTNEIKKVKKIQKENILLLKNLDNLYFSLIKGYNKEEMLKILDEIDKLKIKVNETLILFEEDIQRHKQELVNKLTNIQNDIKKMEQNKYTKDLIKKINTNLKFFTK